METTIKKTGKINQSITFKALIIGFLTLILLVPGLMIQDLIRERQNRSIETIEKINGKWSNAQTICGPILSIPYTTAHVDSNNKTTYQEHVLNITPENLNINTQLFPEERYYGIYKTILYKSETDISGNFNKINFPKIDNNTIHWEQAYLAIGVSDLRGITENIDFSLANKQYSFETTGNYDMQIGEILVTQLNETDPLQSEHSLTFNCKLKLNGSSSINFIPMGKTTKVHISGTWKSPGFIGNFTPEHTITESGFDANWSILSFNRSIPEMWIDIPANTFVDASFGVNLIDPVNHYQQNMRSAKYAIMFIALTFVIFFFVEILTRKRIHPIQYLLVGLALILFYSLLLSISEQINFGTAYLIASIATIGLITAYTSSIFKNKMQTGALTAMLGTLYIFLYVVLQLEDVALLIGSIGLFMILGIIMFFSRKINWYKQGEMEESDKTELIETNTTK